MSIEWMQKLSASTPSTVTKEDVHDKADEKGVVWDSEKPGSQDFLRMSMRVTGKTHLDDMSKQELRRVHATLEKEAGHVEDRIHQRAPTATRDVARLRRALGGLKLRKGRTYHYDLSRGRGSIIVGPTYESHVVKTVYGPGMKAPGTWISEAAVRTALEKRAGFSLREALVKELKEIADAAKVVATTPPTKEQLKAYSRHSALNAGMVARAMRYPTSHPKATTKTEALKRRIADFVNAAAFTALPPSHHKPGELRAMAKGVGSHLDWAKSGYKPWKYADPEKMKTAKVGVVPALQEGVQVVRRVVTPTARDSMRRELQRIRGAAPDASVAARVKKRIAQFFKQQGLPADTKYAVGSGSAQSLLGMRPGQPIRDIDLLVGRLPKGAQRLETGGVDAWTGWRDPRLVRQAFDNPVRVHGVPVMRPQTTFDFKNIIRRPAGTVKGVRDTQDLLALQAYLAQPKGLRKFGEAAGHWRKLPQGQEGHDQGGNPTQGRTWVRKNRMRVGMKPMAHQADFSKAVQQQLGSKAGGGIIAAHGTGTGKTFGSINAFEELKGQGKAKRALVIVPAGLRANFLNKGINQFTTSKGVILKKPTEVSEDTEYVVVSYTAFRLRPQEWLDKVKPDTIIADEVQRATNPEGKTHQALLLARKQVPRFMGLTASIVQNKPDEIVPLLSLATGGTQQLQTKKQFRKAHLQKRVAKQRGIFGGQTYEKKLVRQAKLRASVGGSIHYIEDLDASKKPRKDVETVDVKMSGQQTAQYRKAMKGIDPVIAKKIAEGEPVSQKQAMNVFMKLMRARQVSNSLHLTTAGMSLAQAAEQTPKIKKILDDAVKHIKKTPDAQVIMYTNLVHGGVDVLEAGLKARGVDYGVFAGKRKGITEETRQQAVTDYQAGKKKVIIITGAGAEGLSLGNTTMVQLVDGHYNPERMAQAEARGIRAGGLSHRPQAKRRVRVKRYVSSLDKTWWQAITFQGPEKSVGQWVYRTAEKKQRLNRQLRDVLRDRSTHEKKKRDSRMYRWFGGGP